jgi:nitric oxide reductase subunit C
MLSKSQARLFFLAGTGGFSLVFLGLTVDTIRQVPERSHEEALTAQVIRGKEIWEANNCMGCHTIMGEGGYYAPELTKVVERRGADWIKVFLKDPAAMFPGRRQMVKYDFTPAQIDDVVAFLAWVGQIDTNGFPAEPDLKPAGGAVASATAAGDGAADAALAHAPGMVTSVCLGCHSVGGRGGAVGPAFDGVAGRYTVESLDTWLKNPQAVKPGTAMPNFGLDDGTRKELVAWLMTLD